MNDVKFDIIDEKARTVLIAQNPKSGSSDRRELVRQLADKLESRGLVVVIIQELEKLIESVNYHLDTQELRCVVSAGGDGTVSLLVNHLPAQTPFFVFPLGTANLLAKQIGTSRNIQQATEIIVAGNTTTLDLGKANEQLFLVVASIGFDADVVHKLHAARKGHINYWSYLLPVAKSIWNYPFPQMKLAADGVELKPSRWSFVFNVPKYAVGLRFVENANPQDGRLDLCSFAGGGFWKGLGYFFAVLFRLHQNLAATSIESFERLEVSSVKDTPIPVELDGDPAGFTPVTLSVVPNRLILLTSIQR